MKKIFALAASALALCALASCNKSDLSTPEAPMAHAKKCQITVAINGAAGTKAGANSLDTDEQVNSLQVFLFKDGQLDAYGSAAASEVTISATAGTRSVYALVNAPDLSAVKSESELKASASLLSDNAADGFVMVGSKVADLNASTARVDVDVKRIAARVILRKVTRKYDAAALQGAGVPVTVKRVYMTEVVKNNNYGLDLAKTSYQYLASSLSGHDSALQTAGPFLYHAVADGTIAAHEDSYELTNDTKREGVFFVYPNASVAADEELETVVNKQTRLVIEVEVDGQLYAYPVLIPNILSNKSYEINELVITRLGNSSDGDDVVNPGEDEKIESFDIPFGITIADWDVVLLGDASGIITI